MRKRKANPFTKKCECGSFIEDSVTECDWCVLRKYDLTTCIKYDTEDQLCMEELLPMDEVVKALRKAEK